MIGHGVRPLQVLVELLGGRRLALLGLGLFGAYVVLGRFGLELAYYQRHATIIWAPSGLAIAAVWLLGGRVLWAVFLGALVTNLLVSAEPGLAAGIAIGNTGEAWLGGWMVRRLALTAGLVKPRDVLVYVAAVVLGATLVAALNGVLWLHLLDDLPPARLPLTALMWWLGDAGGVLVVTSVLIAFARPPAATPRLRFDPVAFLLTLVAAVAVFVGPDIFGYSGPAEPWATVICLVLPYPAVTWAAMRLGVRGASATAALVALTAVLGTALGAGPFQTGDPHVDVINLWPPLATLSISAILLASALEAKSAATKAHEEGEARLAFALSAAGASAFERDLAADRARLGRGEPLPLDPAVHPDDRDRLALAIAKAAMGEADGWMLEYQRDDLRIDEHARVTSRDPAGRPLVAVGLRRDVTERYRAAERRFALERELAQSRRLGELGLLAGGVAHDFNNLLTVVRSNADLVRSGDVDGDVREECLRDIDEAARRGKELTEQLLAYAGRRSLPSRVVDLTALAAETTRLLAPRCPEGVTLELQLSAPAQVEGDPVQLRQIVMNLIVNAFDAMADHTGLVRVATLTRGAQVTLTVSDQGGGVPPEARARLFEPFFSTKGPGRGMGLAAVMGIARAHGGTIEVDSEPGRGSTFRVELPAFSAPPALEAPSPPRAAHRVLVVDDEPGVQRLAAFILERAGYEVTTACSGEEAVARATTHRPDVALLDVMLPGDNGVAVMQRLQALHRDLPIVFMSGYCGVEVDARAPLIEKPFKADTLVAAIGAALPRSEGGPESPIERPLSAA